MNVDTASLESMCELIVDCPHSTPKWTDSGVVVLRNQNIRNGQLKLSSPSYTNEAGYQSRVKRAVPQVGDIIFTREAPMGEVCLIPSGLKCCLGQRQVLLRPKETVNGEYLYWALQSPFVQHQISWNEGTGTTVSNVRIPVLKSLQIPRRGSDEQKIADALSSLAHKIRLNHQINQTLEQIAQALFKSWFVDFEPVKAKIVALEAGGSEEDALLAAMQAISGTSLFDAGASAAGAEEQLTRLQAERPEQYAELRATAELFPSAMQDSELGEIPVGWEVDSLASKIDVFNGFAFKSGDYVKQPGIFVLRTKNFNNENIAVRLSDDVFLPEGFGSSHKKYLCEAYDYHLIMVGASVGKTGIIFPCNLPALRNQNMWCFRPKFGARIGKAFTKHMLDELVSQKVGLASGSAREFFRKGDFQNQTICFGSEHIQNSFHSIVFSLLEKQAINVAENGCLSALRDALLPKLLSGELPMTDTDARLAKVEEPVDV